MPIQDAYPAESFYPLYSDLSGQIAWFWLSALRVYLVIPEPASDASRAVLHCV